MANIRDNLGSNCYQLFNLKRYSETEQISDPFRVNAYEIERNGKRQSETDKNLGSQGLSYVRAPYFVNFIIFQNWPNCQFCHFFLKSYYLGYGKRYCNCPDVALLFAKKCSLVQIQIKTCKYLLLRFVNSIYHKLKSYKIGYIVLITTPLKISIKHATRKRCTDGKSVHKGYKVDYSFRIKDLGNFPWLNSNKEQPHTVSCPKDPLLLQWHMNMS